MLAHYAFALFIFGVGVLMLYVFWQSLRWGYVSSDFPPRIHRKDAPISYWLAQVALALGGLVFSVAGLIGLFIR